MLKPLLCFFLFSGVAFSQTTKVDPNSQINAVEQAHGLPGGTVGSAYSVRTDKKTLRAPSNVAPVENPSQADCAGAQGAKGAATFTACEAAKKSR